MNSFSQKHNLSKFIRLEKQIFKGEINLVIFNLDKINY